MICISLGGLFVTENVTDSSGSDRTEMSERRTPTAEQIIYIICRKLYYFQIFQRDGGINSMINEGGSDFTYEIPW